MSTKPTSEPCGGRDDRLPTAETPDIYGAYPRLSDAQIASLATATSIGRNDGQYTVRLDGAAPVSARSVIIATGATTREPASWRNPSWRRRSKNAGTW